MNKLKIIIFGVLLTIGFAFNGELYMLHLDTFQDSYFQSNFYPEQSSEQGVNETYLQDFIHAGEKYRVDFFVVKREIQSAYKEDITISGTEEALIQLQDRGIRKGRNKSLFFGEAEVRFQSFADIPDLSKYDTWYFIGEEKESLDAFKASLVDQYGGGFPKKYGSDRETLFNLLAVWGILFGAALLMTLYAVAYQKKETMVRIILGENLGNIFIKNVLADTVCTSFLFLLIPRLLSGFTNAWFKNGFVLLLFILFLCLNGLLYAGILRVRFKRDLADGNRAEGLLAANYSLKIIASILTLLILAGNAATVREAYNLYIQRDFFREHKNYRYCQLNYKPDNKIGKTEEDDMAMNQEFYERFQKRALQYADLSENFNSTYPVLLHNRSAMKELKKEWPSLKQAVKKAKKEKVYLLLPPEIDRGSGEYQTAMAIGDSFFSESSPGAIRTIPYEGEIEVTGIHRQDSDYQMKRYKNPIILYNHAVFQRNQAMTGYDSYYMYDTMYDISEKEWNAFVREFKLEDQTAFRSGVFDIYRHNWESTSRNMRLTLVLSVFLLLLELFLILFILRLEYQFHAMELALKRIHGYSLLQRNKILIAITAVSSAGGTLLALIISSQLQVPGGYPLLWIGAAFMLVEISYILWKAKAMEQANLAAILKGDQL